MYWRDSTHYKPKKFDWYLLIGGVNITLQNYTVGGTCFHCQLRIFQPLNHRVGAGMYCVAPYQDGQVVQLYRARIISVEQRMENASCRAYAKVCGA